MQLVLLCVLCGHVAWVHRALFLANTGGVCAHQESEYIAPDCPHVISAHVRASHFAKWRAAAMHTGMPCSRPPGQGRVCVCVHIAAGVSVCHEGAPPAALQCAVQLCVYTCVLQEHGHSHAAGGGFAFCIDL